MFGGNIRVEEIGKRGDNLGNGPAGCWGLGLMEAEGREALYMER